MMGNRLRMVMWAGMLAAAAHPARAAHEWRAAWGAPYPLEALAAAAPLLADSIRVSAAHAAPYCVPGLGFQGLHLSSGRGRWQAHAGTLGGGGYREWHLGMGRRLAFGRRAAMLLGMRVFGIRAGHANPRPHTAATCLVAAAPARSPGLVLQIGVADLAFGRETPVPAVMLIRAYLGRGAWRLALERSTTVGYWSETVIQLRIGAGSLVVTQAWRFSLGEAGLAVAIRTAGALISLGQRWHPELGWTPRVAIAWS